MIQGLWVALDGIGFHVVRGLLSLLWQSSILLLAVGMVAFALRRRKASARYRLWVIALLLSPLLPALALMASRAGTPQAELPVMPVYAPPAVIVAAPAEPAPESSADRPYTSYRSYTPAAGFSLADYPWALALAGYAAGLLFFAGAVLLGVRRIRRWIGDGRVVTEEDVLERFHNAARLIGYQKDFTVLESGQIHAPLALGILHPVVLLPKGIHEGLNAGDLDALAIHELSHLRRHDPLILAAVSLVRAVLFFHPLVWLAARQISLLAEQAADDAVLDATGEPVHYAKMLARMAEGLPRRALTTELAAGIVISKGAFLKRVEAILSARRDRIRRVTRIALAGMVIGLLLSIGIAVALPLGEKGKDKAAQTATDDKLELKAGPNVITGVVVDEEGRPVSGARVRRLYETDEAGVAKTRADGSFTLDGGDSVRFYGALWATTEDGLMQGFAGTGEPGPSKPTAYRIVVRPSRQVAVIVKDANGRPVGDAGVEVIHAYEPLPFVRTDAKGIALLRIPADAKVGWVIALKSGVGFDYFENYQSLQSRERPPLPERIELTLDGARTVRVEAVDSSGRPLPDVPFVPWTIQKPGKIADANVAGSSLIVSRTDERGIAVFDWLPKEMVDGSAFLVVRNENLFCPKAPVLKADGNDAVLTAKLLRTVPITGKVLFPDGSPVPNVLVQVEGRGNTNHYCRCFARSDAEGKWKAMAYPDQSYVITALDEEWATKSIIGLIVREGAPLDDLNLQLIKGTVIHGKVATANDDKAVAGQTVTLKVMGGKLPAEWRGFGEEDASLIRWAKTDDEGRYRFRVGPGEYELWGGDWRDKRQVTVGSEEEILEDFQVSAPESSPLRITVMHGDRAVAGAKLQAEGLGTHFEGVSDQEGVFRTNRYGGEAMLLMAASPDGETAAIRRLSATETDIEIELMPAAKIEGRVLDEKGGPVANQRMQCQINYPDDLDDVRANSAVFLSEKTNKNGGFSFGGVPTGVDCFVSPVLQDESLICEGWDRQIVVNEPGAIQFGDLKIVPAPAVSGVVLSGGARNEPSPNALVNCAEVAGRNWRADGMLRLQEADKEGRFKVFDVKGHVVAYARDREGTSACLAEILPDEEHENITLKLSPAGTVTGRLVDSERKPLRHKQLYLSVWPESRLEKRLINWMFTMDRTDGDGRFSIPGLPVGLSYEITPMGEDGTYEKPIPFEIMAAETADLGTILLSPEEEPKFLKDKEEAKPAAPAEEPSAAPGFSASMSSLPAGTCRLAGKVVSAKTGEPVGGARLYLHWSDGREFAINVSGKDGSFDFAGIPEGTYSFQVSGASGFQPQSYDPTGAGGQYPQFVLKEGEERTNIEFKLAPGYRITGRILNENGEPLALAKGAIIVHAWVEEVDQDGARRIQSMAQTQVTTEDGSYNLDGLDGRPVYVSAETGLFARPSEYYPTIYYPGTFDHAEAKLIAFDDKSLVEGIDIRLTRQGGLAVEGVVTDSETGKPISGAAIYAHTKTVMFDFKKTQTDENGRYRLETLPRGEVLVQFDASGQGYVRTCKAVTLEGKSVPRLNVALEQGVTLAGSFVDEEGNPVEIARGKAFGHASIEGGRGSPTCLMIGLFTSDGGTTSGATERLSFTAEEGDYISGDMTFPTTGSFMIRGLMPGRTKLSFDPKEPGAQVLKILSGDVDLAKTALVTFGGEQYEEIKVVLSTPKKAPKSTTAPQAAAGVVATSQNLVAASGTVANASKPKSAVDIKPPFTFRIHTVKPDGSAEPGVKVRCLYPDVEGVAPIVDEVKETDENGNLEFVVNKGDLTQYRTFWFSVADERFVGGPKSGKNPLQGAGEATFRVLPSREFKFLVLNEKGRPVPDARLKVYSRQVLTGTDAVSDAKGIAALRFADGPMSIIVTSTKGTTVQLEGVHLDGDTPFEIRLKNGAEITGRVINADGNPLAGIPVEAAKVEERVVLPPMEEFIVRVTTDDDGTFVLPHIGDGPNLVAASLEQTGKPLFVEPVLVRVKEGKSVAPVTLTTQPGVALKGRYVSSDDMRFNRRLIQVNRGTAGGPRYVYVSPRADGTFEIGGLPSEGTVSVEFMGISGREQSIHLPPNLPAVGGGPTRGQIQLLNVPSGVYDGIEVRFSTSARVHAKVRDKDGNPLPRVKFVAWPGGEIFKTDLNGDLWAGVATGQEVVIETWGPPTQWQPYRSEPMVLKEGELRELEIVLLPLNAIVSGPEPETTRTAPTPAASEPYAWQRTDRYVPPDPESFFPDDEEGGRLLDALFTAVDNDKRSDEEIFSTVRRGLRRTTQHRSAILRWIGNRYIWNKQPQNPQAIEILYQAVPWEQHFAVYFGLSVMKPKSPNVLRLLSDLCLQGEEVGRITWGIGDQRGELVALIEPHAKDADPAVRETASLLLRHFRGEVDFDKERELRRILNVKAEFGDQMPELREALMNGDSAARKEALDTIARNRLGPILDESILPAMKAAAEDKDLGVQREVARQVGSTWIWGQEVQSPEAIALALRLANDPDRNVQYNSVYHGLSVIRDMSPETVERLVAIALNDHEWNMYGRISWGLRHSSNGVSLAAADLESRAQRAKSDKERAAIYFLYEELLGKPAPAEWGLTEAAAKYERDLFLIYYGSAKGERIGTPSEVRAILAGRLPEGILLTPFAGSRSSGFETVTVTDTVEGVEARDAVVKAIESEPRLVVGRVSRYTPIMQLDREESGPR
jgi:beta-lactamase regulating signal transducer with metallopeptidase domain